MNKLLPAALILLLATPLLAQGRSIDVMGFVTYVDLSGGDVILGGGDSSSISFDTDQGYGVGINLFLTRRLSAEITIAEIKPDARVSSGSMLGGAQLDMIPITAVAQYHFNPEGKVDPYVGMGIAYLMFDEFSSRDPDLDLGDVDIRNDYCAVFNAGLSFELGFGFALFGDVKYVPVENKITTRIGEQTIDLNPLIVSAGVVIRF
jgi:outer membrane protein